MEKNSITVNELPSDIAKLFPTEVCRNIFGHLGVKDLKECFLVNKDWNEIISSSANCMKKISVKFNGIKPDKNERNLKKGLLRSSRKYQNIEICHTEIDGCYEEIFKNGKGRWKKVNIVGCKFRSEESFASVVESIRLTVEELSI